MSGKTARERSDSDARRHFINRAAGALRKADLANAEMVKHPSDVAELWAAAADAYERVRRYDMVAYCQSRAKEVMNEWGHLEPEHGSNYLTHRTLPDEKDDPAYPTAESERDA